MVGLPQQQCELNEETGLKPEEIVAFRGTTRGFELVIDSATGAEQIAEAARAQLSKSPSFFAGSDVIIQFAGHPVAGALGLLEDMATEFELTIVSVRSELESSQKTKNAALAVVSELMSPAGTDSVEVDFSDCDDSGGNDEPQCTKEQPASDALDSESDDLSSSEPTVLLAADEVSAAAVSADELDDGSDADDVDGSSGVVDSIVTKADGAESDAELEEPGGFELVSRAPPAAENRYEAFDAVRALALQSPDAAKVIIGPVRSGCILEATEHVVIVGDVNPGAEITSIGAIIVLGRMRGIAHAGAGGSPAFIFALELEPQQLRLGTKVARASDAERSRGRRLFQRRVRGPEIARLEDEQIIVESYAGKLPGSLAGMLS